MSRTHGQTGTRTHGTWLEMRKRCYSPGYKDFKYYGGRGIKVCERWAIYANFLADMGEKPAGMSIDRIDNDGDYSPGNCRWTTRKVQERNKRTNRLITAFGEVKTMADWLDDPRCAVTRGTFCQRLKMQWSPERAIAAKPVWRGRNILPVETGRPA